MKRHLLLLLVFVLFGATSVVAHGQLFHPLGLGIEASNDMVGEWFQPQMHIEGDILYACTNQGLYSKDLSNEGSEWQLVGFEGIPLQDYVRRGEDILALRHCYYVHSEFLLLSHDGGKTYEDITPAFFKGRGYAFLSLEQHPTDPNTLLTSSCYNCGLFLTTDFGQTWNKLADYTPEYTGFHPLNPDIIYESGGEHLDEITDLHISYDGGHTWQNRSSQLPHYREIYRMAFHPTDPNKWIVGGNYCVHSTNDNGQTWNSQALRDYDNPLNPINEDYNAPWRYAAYDNENPDIVYMTGCARGGYMKLMCSMDGGESWNRPYLEPIKTMPTEYVFDMKQYGDKLLVYSQSDVYMVSKADLIAQTTPVTFTAGQIATIILPTEPDASKGKYYRLDRYEDGQIIFEEETHPQARTPYVIVPNEDFNIDLSTLDVDGLRFDTLKTEAASPLNPSRTYEIRFVGTYAKREIGEKDNGFRFYILDTTPDCIYHPEGKSSITMGPLRAHFEINIAFCYDRETMEYWDELKYVLHDYGTGIASPLRETEEGAIFDLQGRKLQGKPTRGIYIGNGKKILIK